MAQIQKVSWRTVGYVALGTAAFVAGTVGIVNSDGVRPTSLKSNAATRWLVDQVNHNLVLADGLTGRVLARIDSGSESTDQAAYQGVAGAFLVARDEGSVRAISTAKMQLGTPQKLASLAQDEDQAQLGVGANGLTVINPQTDEANVVTVDDVARPIKVPISDDALVARDGSMWLFTATQATHVNIDESKRSFDLRGTRGPTATVGGHAFYLDREAGVLHWLDGGDVPVGSIGNLADAIVQRKGDDAPCAWIGAGDRLACVGSTGIDTKFDVPGLRLGPQDQLAVAGSVAAVIRNGTNLVQRVDLDTGRLIANDNPEPTPSAVLSIVAINGMIWIDDQSSELAWVINSFGVWTIHKNDDNAPLLDAQGQVMTSGTGNGPSSNNSGDPSNDESDVDHLDHNDKDDPPKAFDDSVTARAGNTITIPVTDNDYDPDGQAIAVLSVGGTQPAGHGTTDVLNGTSVSYVPEPGFTGSDSFSYTIVDERGNQASATVNVQLFAPDSPNRPPIGRRNQVKTHVGRAVTIDVLANDIDPERDVLSVGAVGQVSTGTVTETTGPSGLPALKYQPPSDRPGVYTFTYQAADPQGGISENTPVTVDVSGADSENVPPDAEPDAIRLPVGRLGSVNVRANDTDPDGDDLTIAPQLPAPTGVQVHLARQQLDITLEAGAAPLSVVSYILSDGQPIHETIGHVLVVRVDDTAENRPPVANPDTERVVVGGTVKIPVTANDIDPDRDTIRLLTVSDPPGGAGTTVVDGNFVRFTPSLPNITEPTPVTFTYRIGDGNQHVATGTVTVTVLAEALPRAPIAADDFADTVADKPVNIPVLDNDSDPSGGHPNLVGDPSCLNGGSAVRTADQRITFTPPTGGATGTFRCTYTVANSQGLRASASIIVTVTQAPPGNRPPQLASNVQPEVNVGDTITLSANQFASDQDGDPLVFSSVSKPTVGQTNFVGKADSFVYTAPSTGTSDDLPTPINLEVTISDGRDGNVSGLISIKINSNPPTVKTPPSVVDIARNALVGDQVPVNVLTELRGLNPGTLTLLSATADTASDADVTYNTTTGIVNIVPKVAGTVTVTYRVQNDQLAASGKIVVTVTAVPVNPPALAVGDELTVSSGGSGNVNVLLNDGGLSEPNDAPKAQLQVRPTPDFGTADLTNGILSFAAAPWAQGTQNITYSVTDGNGPASIGTVAITILACADSPPRAVKDATAWTGYQQPLPIDLTQLASWGHVVPSSVHGAGLTGPIGVYTPPAGKNDNEVVTFDVENGCHQTDSGQLTIDVNRVPSGFQIRRQMTQGDTITLLVSDIASDDEALSIIGLDSQPSWISLVAGTDGARINVAPDSSTANGTYVFNATVQDPGGLTATATITVDINNVAPTAVADAYTTTQTLFTLFPDPTVNDTDAEPGPLMIQNIFVVDGQAQIVSRTGNVVTVSLGHGVSHFAYTIVDRGGLTSSASITITSNRPPEVADVVAPPTNQPTLLVTLSPTDPDGPGDSPLTIVCSNPTSNFDVTVLADPDPGPPPIPDRVRLYILVRDDFVGTDIIFCTVTDPYGATATAKVTVTITS